MTSTKTEPKLVVLQLSGGNDPLNSVVPYTDELYYDYRPSVRIEPDDVLKIDDHLGFHPSMGPIKRLWDEGKVAIINGIGYPNPSRSHFRSMDIWHTAEPDRVGPDGWLGRAIRDLDPRGENVLTGVNFGRGLPRALSCKGVPVASVSNLETYGLFPNLRDEAARAQALEAFGLMYGATEGKDAVAQFLSQTGTDAMRGADVLRTALDKYSSGVVYAATSISQSFKGVAQVMLADLGTKVYYTEHGSFDTHASELVSLAKLWHEVSTAVGDFMDDLRQHDREDDAIILVFSEFGRRIGDNGSGTDHGTGGVAFVIGGPVQGGLYGEYPSLREKDQVEGDLQFNNDFRGTYSTVLQRWLGLDPGPIVNGQFEQLDCVPS